MGDVTDEDEERAMVEVRARLRAYAERQRLRFGVLGLVVPADLPPGFVEISGAPGLDVGDDEPSSGRGADRIQVVTGPSCVAVRDWQRSRARVRSYVVSPSVEEPTTLQQEQLRV